MKKESSLSKLFVYAGKFRYLTIASWILSVISVIAGFGTILSSGELLKEVLSVARILAQSSSFKKEYGWAAVGFAIYPCWFMCAR